MVTGRMSGERPVLYIFAVAQADGVPVEPTFKRLRPSRVEAHVLTMMREGNKPILFVWDWQHDGVRFRVARIRNKQVRWSTSTYWLLHGDREVS